MARRFIEVKVTPRAPASALEQQPDGRWRATLKSPPDDGRANAELIALVARRFGCARRAVAIQSGGAGRTKLLRIELDDDGC